MDTNNKKEKEKILYVIKELYENTKDQKEKEKFMGILLKLKSNEEKSNYSVEK